MGPKMGSENGPLGSPESLKNRLGKICFPLKKAIMHLLGGRFQNISLCICTALSVLSLFEYLCFTYSIFETYCVINLCNRIRKSLWAWGYKIITTSFRAKHSRVRSHHQCQSILAGDFFLFRVTKTYWKLSPILTKYLTFFTVFLKVYSSKTRFGSS